MLQSVSRERYVGLLFSVWTTYRRFVCAVYLILSRRIAKERYGSSRRRRPCLACTAIFDAIVVCWENGCFRRRLHPCRSRFVSGRYHFQNSHTVFVMEALYKIAHISIHVPGTNLVIMYFSLTLNSVNF